MTDEYIDVEVAYAKSEEQVILPVQGKRGITVEEAIRKSGILERYPEIDLTQNKVGVFGKASTLEAMLYPGDRVEIYRTLIADPKEARKKRAAKGKPMKKGAAAENSGD